MSYPDSSPQSPSPPALECRGLRKTYGPDRVVFEGLDFTLAPGEYVAIMGESGVGKSTLLNLVAGLDSMDGGELLLDGVPMSSLDDDAATLLRRQKLGFVFQAFHILPHLNLLQNISLPLLLNGQPPERAAAMLEAVGLGGRGEDFRASCRAGNCSGWRSRGRWCIGRACCWRMSRPAISIPIPRTKCCNCCVPKSARAARPR